MNRILSYISVTALCSGAFASPVSTIDLSGKWNVEIPGAAADGPIMLPGTTDMAEYGIPVDTLSLSRDEQFRRLTRRWSHIGPATYSRNVTVTPDMADKPLELNLERVIWKTTAKIGGKDFDNVEHSLVAPHRHVLREGLPAGEYLLEIEVDNSRQFDISVNNLAHAYTNDTQTMWNGILGDMTLRALPEVGVNRVEVYPSASLDSVKMVAFIDNLSGEKRKEKVYFSLGGKREKVKMKLLPGENRVEATLPSGSLERWNEFNPVLHTAEVSVGDEVKSVIFGLRSVDNKGGLRVNGVPVFLRGTLECCVFPLTGTPPTDREGWLNTFEKARSWGLNHLRFHSWCPPEAAFEVADSLGFYLQVELPVWSLRIGDDPEAENFLKEEFERIVKNYGNHPSLCFLSVGNELQHDFVWLNSMVAEMKQRDPRHLYTTTSFTFEKGHGGKPEPEDEFFVTQWTDNGWVRGQGVFETERPTFDKNYDSSIKGIDVPLISHEIGQYAVYPRVAEIEKYTGTLNPLNFKNVRSDLESKGMLGDAEAMTQASGKLAAILYKEEIERAMKTSGMSGYQLLGLQDFPGQGTALVGLADAFWDNKGAVTEEWFREFCAPVVPLLDFGSAVYDAAGDFSGEVLVANFSDKPLPSADVAWTLTVEGMSDPFASGLVTMPEVAAGEVMRGGSFSVPLSGITVASPVIVGLSLPGGEHNSWRIHVYPEKDATAGRIFATRSAEEAMKALSEGRDVLLSPSPDSIRGVESKFLPVFWSPVHFPKQAGTMGILCDPSDPALSGFPNRGHSDWQWWTPARNAKVVVMDSIQEARPIVKVIDNFVNNRKLAYMFEAKCGNGRLLFSAIDLLNPEVSTPEMNALRNSVLDYMNTDSFSPSGIIQPEVILDLTSVKDSGSTTTATSIYE